MDLLEKIVRRTDVFNDIGNHAKVKLLRPKAGRLKFPAKNFATVQVLLRFFTGGGRIFDSGDKPSFSFGRDKKISVPAPDFQQSAIF